MRIKFVVRVSERRQKGGYRFYPVKKPIAQQNNSLKNQGVISFISRGTL